MKSILLSILFIILTNSLFSQETEKGIRKRLIEIAYNNQFTDLKEIKELKLKADKYSKSTSTLADYTLNQVKMRRTGQNDSLHFTQMSANLIRNLQMIDLWEIEKDQENLAFGYGHIAHGLYNLEIYEYATIYFKRKLDLKRRDSLFLKEIYEYANCYLEMDRSPQNSVIIINSNIKEIESIAEENGLRDSILFEFNMLLVEANYKIKQYVECIARLEQNVRYSDKLSIDKKIEAFVNLANLKLSRGLKYEYLFEVLERLHAKDARSKRKILEARIKFAFENELYNELPDLVGSYLDNFSNAQGDDSYRKILMYSANLNFINKNYRKAYKEYDELLNRFGKRLSTEDELMVLGNLGYCAEEIGKKKQAINYLKEYIEKKSEYEIAKEEKNKQLQNIIYWFRTAKNTVEFESRKSGYLLVDAQKDSLQNQNLKLEKAEAEKKLSDERNRIRMYFTWFWVVAGISALVAFIYFYRTNKKNNRLLLNILPPSIAKRLKSKKRFAALKKDSNATIIDEFPQATILFADFKGFTKIAEQLTPEELVEELNQCFAKFDEIMKANRLEKIKTIGDAYMAAGGIPEANTTNAKDAISAALEMVKFIEDFKQKRLAEGQPEWNIRIGINTGHIVAGIIGKHKYAYDVWGDAVNVASRMESSGEAGRINISEDTYNLVKEDFKCTYRGEVEAKNKGKVKMYFVEGKK